MGQYEQTSSESIIKNPTMTIGEVGKVIAISIKAEEKRIKREKKRLKLLKMIGNGKYCNIGADYRLAYNSTPYNQESLPAFLELRQQILNIVKDSHSNEDLQSLFYGICGELGNRRLCTFIESNNLSDEQIREIGFTDACYLGITDLTMLDKFPAYVEGFDAGIEKSIVEPVEQDEVVRALNGSLNQIKANKKK